MNIAKIELWNTMNDEWVDHRLECYIERDVVASVRR